MRKILLIIFLFILLSLLRVQKTIVFAQTNFPDIDALYIERSPRLDYDGSKKWPSYNEVVIFSAHVKNMGTVSANNISYQWKINNVVAAQGTISSLSPNEEKTVTYEWHWLHQVQNDRIQGRHTVEFIADPANSINEISENNNTIRDFTQALGVGFWVEQQVYDYFNQNQLSYCAASSCLGSNSWEDWAQRQIKLFNRLLETSTSSYYPQGAIDRVRLDKVVVMPNCTITLDNNPPLDKTVDLVWGFTSAKVEPVPGCIRDENDGNKRLYKNRSEFQNLEYPLVHELSHARYLIDAYGLNVKDEDVLVTENGQTIAGSSLLPRVSNNLVYKNKEQRMMGGGLMTDGYDPHSIGALNRVAGLRARGGNYNAPSVIGEYLQELPATTHLKFLSDNSMPIPNAQISIFQATSKSKEWYSKQFNNPPILSGTTNTQGIFTITGNPFGSSISHAYGFANGVFLYRIQYGNQVRYGFQEITDLNLAYWQGDRDEATILITTAISGVVITPTSVPLTTSPLPTPTYGVHLTDEVTGQLYYFCRTFRRCLATTLGGCVSLWEDVKSRIPLHKFFISGVLRICGSLSRHF